ncbi:phosphotransferase enzyme family-domain-containing protein [Kalaharituber pfeilii]|nr:phosphotransferase enzyme family-domain-containing protein [Kalaharituber pfeilii]
MTLSQPLTRTPLTVFEAQEIIDSIFPPPVSDPSHGGSQSNPLSQDTHPGPISKIEELTSGGTFNTCYILHFCPANPSLGDHLKLVLKIGPQPDVRLLRYENTPTPLLSIEAYLLNLLHQQQHTPNVYVPAPKVLAYDDTLTLLDSPFLLTTYLPGTPLSELRARGALTEEQLQEVEYTVGRLLRVVNETRAGGGVGGWDGAWGMVTGQPCRGASEWYLEHVEGLLRDGEDLRLLLPYAEVRKAMRTWAKLLGAGPEHRNDGAENNSGKTKAVEELALVNALDYPPSTPRLCILDFSDSSVLVDPATAQVMGLIDLERAYWGDPIAQEIFQPRNPRRKSVIAGYNSWPISSVLGSSAPLESTTRDTRKRISRKCREMLYTILTSTTKILNSYSRQLRQQDGSFCDEMVERKRLVEALRELGALEGVVLG